MKKVLCFLLVMIFLSSSISFSVSDASHILCLPLGLREIDNMAFMDTTGIESVILPYGVEAIGSKAFANSSLKEINLPDSLIYIADDAFEDCDDVVMSAKVGTYAYQWAVDHHYISDSNYVLDIYWIGNGDNEYVRRGVEQAISEYIHPLIGATVRLHIIGWGDWYTDAIVALEQGEKIDLLFTADWEGYDQEVRGGLLRGLDTLLDQYGQGIKESMPSSYLEGVKYNGTLYAIPTHKELCVPQGFVINKTVANSIGWDVQPDDPDIRSTLDLEPCLAKYKLMYPDKYPYLMESYSARWADEPWVPSFINELGMNAISMKMAADENGNFDDTIYNIFETQEQESHIRLMYNWAQKGYISPEASSSYYDYYGVFGRGDFLVFPQPLLGNGLKSVQLYDDNATAEFECVEITVQDKYVVTIHSGGSMFGIPITSENPEKAMQFLNLMHTDKSLVNMMVYGVEGVNYHKVNDSQIEVTDLNWYAVHGGAWTVGNVSLQYVLTNENPEKNHLLQDYAEGAIESLSLGFRFCVDVVSDIIDAVNDVINTFAVPLMFGKVNPDSEIRGIAVLRRALVEAGINDLIEEVRSQFQNWLLN